MDAAEKAKPRWVYEWPMRKAKVKWPVKELMARRQRRLLRGWLRHAENLNRPERKWFRYVNQRLGEVSVVRMNWDQLKISSTARRAEKKFQFPGGKEDGISDVTEDSQGSHTVRRAMDQIVVGSHRLAKLGGQGNRDGSGIS
jgi:hypothetical protein